MWKTVQVKTTNVNRLFLKVSIWPLTWAVSSIWVFLLYVNTILSHIWHICLKYNLSKKVPRQFNGAKKLLFKKYHWDKWIFTCKKMMVGPYFTTCIKINYNHRPKNNRYTCKPLRRIHRGKSSLPWIKHFSQIWHIQHKWKKEK
jgi:hypothetical protein